MANELERRWLITANGRRWPHIEKLREGSTLLRIAQGYLTEKGKPTTRVRITDSNNDLSANLCLKFKGGDAGTPEYEYPIPVDDAHELMVYCESRVIHKRRYVIPLTSASGLDYLAELDVFASRHEGLVVVEIEKPVSWSQEDWAAMGTPKWLEGFEEITNVKGWSNRKLAMRDTIKP